MGNVLLRILGTMFLIFGMFLSQASSPDYQELGRWVLACGLLSLLLYSLAYAGMPSPRSKLVQFAMGLSAILIFYGSAMFFEWWFLIFRGN